MIVITAPGILMFLCISYQPVLLSTLFLIRCPVLAKNRPHSKVVAKAERDGGQKQKHL